jgi:uncharacterized OB-fold protein
MEAIRDWTRGGEGIAYQACGSCHAAWYFRRSFCPACGAADPQTRQAAGLGTLHALTRVTRAPTEELRAHAPYVIALVDADEGFRLMAHCAPDLQIGDRVRVKFTDLAARKVPFFDRSTD